MSLWYALLWDIPRSSIMGYPNFASKKFYVINDVPIKWCGNVIIDDTFCGNSDVTTCVPLEAKVGVLKRQISISQKSVPLYRLIIDFQFKNVSKLGGSRWKPVKNGIDRLKVHIFYDFRFKTQHQYKSYTKWASFWNDKISRVFCGAVFSEFPIFFISKK